MSPCWAGQLIPVLSEAATKHFNSSGIYENQTVIEQRGCFFIWKEWKDPKRNKGKFISDMHIEIYRYEDYLQYPLNRTSALRKFPKQPNLMIYFFQCTKWRMHGTLCWITKMKIF